MVVSLNAMNFGVGADSISALLTFDNIPTRADMESAPTGHQDD